LEVRVKIPGWLEKPAVFALLLYRRLRYGHPFRRIKLTQNKYTIVDPEDYERLSKHKWYAVKQGRSFYARRCVSIGGGKQKGINMHREVMKVAGGKFCDHINHNGLDNRNTNLRPASRAENSWNKRKQRSKHSSKYKGVSRPRNEKRWTARIQANGRKIFIGCFEDEAEAAKAYDEAARKYHGQFASLNFD
jgi:hypothetical protein